jgi:hypothetical protein
MVLKRGPTRLVLVVDQKKRLMFGVLMFQHKGLATIKHGGRWDQNHQPGKYDKLETWLVVGKVSRCKSRLQLPGPATAKSNPG